MYWLGLQHHIYSKDPDDTLRRSLDSTLLYNIHDEEKIKIIQGSMINMYVTSFKAIYKKKKIFLDSLIIQYI